MSDFYVELDRTFHLSAATIAKSDEVDLARPFGRRGQMTWADLLARPRVVILSGGGAGKTYEIRHRAKLLHAQGRPAFFLRIEHVREDFAGAFDKVAGNHEQFLEWVKSGDEGWVFLDSVDEARLKSPKEFEQAINFVGRALEPVLQRAHIVITGREAAWRPRTDRELIRMHLPYESSTPSVKQSTEEELPAPKEDEIEPMYMEADVGSDDLETDYDGASDETVPEQDATSQVVESNAVLIVGFDNLNEEQVETFVRAKGMTDVASFMRAVERKEAQSETARPLDLEGLVDYWNVNGKIGSQFELTEATIARRLAEVDSDRAEATTLTREQLRRAACTLAAANMLMQAPEIRLHDAPPEVRGVEPSDLLDLSEKDIRTLLLRPLFVAGQFGAVRLYVQKAREFLTAEWLHGRLVDHASRARIEALFFRMQYGKEVVIPSMRGVLPWLARLDPEILARVRRVAPEVMFEGGDPSRLPFEMRRDLLSKACAQLAGNARRSSLTDIQAVRRFAAPDLASHIKALLIEYRDDAEVTYFLLRMVWQGEVFGVLEEAKEIASNATEFNVRLIALRAVAALGTDADHALVRKALLSGTKPPEREWVAEVIQTLPRDAGGIRWLLKACVRAKREKRYSIDPMPDAIEAYVTDLPLENLPSLILGLQPLLASSSGNSNDDDTRRPQPYDWLTGASIAALKRLVVARDAAVFKAPAIALLIQIPAAVRLSDNDNREDSSRLAEQVCAWTELNRRLFWSDVEATRTRRHKKKGEPLTDFWGVGMFGHYWRLTPDDFDYFEKEIGTRLLLDDRLVALSVAYALYRENSRPPSWRQRLRRCAKGIPELEAALEAFLGPQSEQHKKWRRQEARWKKRSAQQAVQRDINREQWRKHLQSNVTALRTLLPRGGIRNSQHYLSTRMREANKNSSRWTDGKWRSLIPEFGLEVATAFRDGAIAFWRTYKPELLSNGAESNTTPFAIIFGLTGLLFESRESRDWATILTTDDAKLASRYALHELNGFPPWLPQLFASHQKIVTQLLLREIDYELSKANAIDSASHYVLSDVSSVGSWLWNALAPKLIKRMRSALPSANHLRQLLVILAGSDVDGTDIAKLASKHAKSEVDELAAIWFAAWIGVEPERAVPAFSAHLAALPEKVRQVSVAMHCLIALTGGRHGTRVARDGYRTVPHLTTLFLLMHQYIVESEDLQRAGKGVYSPNVRDDAQDARDGLLMPLKDTPGQEGYFALQRIANEHPSKRGRDWAAQLAHERAVADADRPGWIGSQVREFQDKLECTPRNPQELYDLAVERLLDYKHFLEHGETSNAEVLLSPLEPAVRNVVANWCQDRGLNRYLIAQEEERADKKRTDVRFRSTAFDNPVPVELKLANAWAGTDLVERLENQLCNDYLRDSRSSRGIFLLMYQGGRKFWDLPDGTRVTTFEGLTAALQAHWVKVAKNFPHVHAVQVIGIDLTMRMKPKGRAATKKAKKKMPEKTRAQPRSKQMPKATQAKKATKGNSKSVSEKTSTASRSRQKPNAPIFKKKMTKATKHVAKKVLAKSESKPSARTAVSKKKTTKTASKR